MVLNIFSAVETVSAADYIKEVPIIKEINTVGAHTDVKIQWTKVPQVKSYLVAMINKDNGNKLINNVVVTGTSYLIKASKLNPGTTYKFWVGVTNASGKNKGSYIFIKVKNETNVTVNFSKSANKSTVSDYSLSILKDVLSKAGVKSATISSTTRTPTEQATVMYENIKRRGIRNQLSLYKKNGDAVINVYKTLSEKENSKSSIIEAMTKKIKELGPSTVSKHCANPSKINVIDIAPSSISNKAAFLKEAKKDPRISKILDPSDGDPTYHIEIPIR